MNGGYYKLPALVFVADVILTVVLLTILSYVDVLDEAEDVGVEIASWLFVATILYISFEEELMFRIIPLLVALKFIKQSAGLVGVALLTAVVFGYVHGGVYNILLQGIGGFLYAVIFIKYSQNGTRILEASLLVIVLHTFFNGLIGIVLLLSGETMF